MDTPSECEVGGAWWGVGQHSCNQLLNLYFIGFQALIRFKNYFYFEEKDEPVEEFEKVPA